ncbi:acyclic terpene utilization AtuA family protein [Streptomyces sp. NPDC006879]|uniref:acyclic terpene utilization AtuA family protein n=1 Tax=Streptomyces sp. NPDC006879 TaxID=3364767 RepID=UPI00367710A9
MREMLTGGPLDVLTGDYLAELTMLILGRDRLRDPSTGYAKTFLRQLEEGLGLAKDHGVRIVTNAGGLHPAALARSIEELAEKSGLAVSVGYVTGDDLPPPSGALTANAYLGGAGITACLRAGADVVVTGRVTDAALVSGPAAWWFDWSPEDYDALAGATVAGHVLECGTQATGGNYAFFTEHDVRNPGFPLAEIHADGSCVVTKHPGTGGVVDTGTVTAQLLYETQGAAYLGPDVTTRLDTVRLEPEGPDRVRVFGVCGQPPPERLKVGVTRIGGWRNELVFVLTGLDIPAKADLLKGQFEDALARSGRRPAHVDWELSRTDRADAPTEETASALLRLVVRDADATAVERALTSAAVELALASYPGFHLTSAPAKPSPYGVFETHYVDRTEVRAQAVLPDGTVLPLPPGGPPTTTSGPPPPASGACAPPKAEPSAGLASAGPPAADTVRVPLGLIAGARSGDKGGDANIGVWVRSEEAYRWLLDTLTVQRLAELLPETRGLTVTRHPLPRLRALNFLVEGILGQGVASRHRFDPQAKALGEWLRARHLDVPRALLEPSAPTTEGTAHP